MSAGPKGYVGRAMRRLASKTSAFVCISDYVRGLVQGYGVPAGKCVRIYCGTDIAVNAEFPSSLRASRRLGADTPVVGATGVWRPNKGFTYFLAACELVHQHDPGARFLLGGKAYAPDASFAASLWVRAQPLRSAGVLEFTGYVPDIGRFMSALDIFVLPSDCEPFGLVLVEAMARGKAVVATAAGGVPEIVQDGESGILVPPRDPEAMAAAIRRLLSDPGLRGRMGENGRARVRRLFSEERMAAEYEALYERLIGSKA